MFPVRHFTFGLLALALVLGLSAALAKAEDSKKETGTVSGVVSDKDGKPVAGADVGIFHPMGKHAKADKVEGKANGDKPAKPAKGEKPVPVVPSVKTDDKGEFTISDVPVGDYVVRARMRGQGSAQERLNVKAGETEKVTLKLEYKAKGEKPADKGAEKGGDAK